MANISQNIINNKLKRLSLKSLYQQTKHNPLVLLNLLALEHNLSFKEIGKSYQCTTSSGLKVIKTPNGYTVHNHSNKHDVPNGNISTQIRVLTSNLTGIDKANKQYAIFEQIGVNVSDASHQGKPRFTPTQANINTPIEAKTNSPSKLTFKLDGFGNYCGKETLKYFRNKTGATKTTLKKYNVSPVIEHSVDNYTFRHGTKNFAFAYSTKTVTRKKEPNSLEHEYQSITHNKGVYCFGLEQLPKKGNSLIICAGETDAICINHHLNKYGVFAICFNSENFDPPKQLIHSLKLRFNRTFVLYDYDKAGLNGKKIAFENNLIWVNLAPLCMDYPSINDVCDMYTVFSDELTSQLLRLINSNDRIEADKEDVFSLAIPHVSVVNFDSYISEKEENVYQLANLIISHKSTAIWGAPGTGKSWALVSLIPKLLNIKGVKRVVQVVPTKAIGGQIYGTVSQQHDGSTTLLQGTKDKYVMYHIESSQVIISTYDSITNVPLEYMKESVLFIDEAHQLCNDIDYRNKAMTSLYDYIKNAFRVVYLTATPNWLFFSPSIEKYLGKIHLIKGNHNLDNEVVTSIYTNAPNKKHNRYYIEDNIPKEEGKTNCIKLDNADVIDKWHKLDIDRGIRSDHFTSKEAKRSTSNANYMEIQSTGKLKEPLDYLYYTALMEAGVSFKFPVGAICVLDTIAACRAAQLATRPRYDKKTGINKSIQLHIFLGKQRKSKGRAQTSEQRLETYLSAAKSLAAQKNGLESGKIKLKLDSDFVGQSTYQDTNGDWQVSVFYILHKIFLEQQKEQTPELLSRRLFRYDKRFKVLPIQSLPEIEENSDLNQLLATSKADKETIENALFDLLKQDPERAISAYVSRLRKAERKEQIRGILKLPLYADLSDYIEENSTAFLNPKLTGKIVNLLIAKTALKEDVIKGVSHILKNGLVAATKETQSQLHGLRTKLAKAAKKGKCELSVNDQIEYKIDRAIIKKFDQIKKDTQQGKIKGKYKGQKLAQLVNAARPKGVQRVTKGKALKRLKVLYQLKYNKKTCLYTIGDRMYSK